MKTRHQNDFYETLSKLTRQLLNHVDISGTILEPCAGSSAITKVLQKYVCNKVYESDRAWQDVGHGVCVASEPKITRLLSSFVNEIPQ